MTRKRLAEIILNTVNNSEMVGCTQGETILNIENILTVLKPIDLNQFAKWGQPHEQSTVEECWK
jgi:hypothetical protein